MAQLPQPRSLHSPVDFLAAGAFCQDWFGFYAAYNIHDKNLYLLALCTYLIVLSHFAGELLVYGTMKIGKGLALPLFVATTSVVWMLMQWSFYVD